MSNESAPKSFVKLAVGTTSFSSTPNLSTIIAFTLEEISSDERQWAWMDEGLTTFVQYLAPIFFPLEHDALNFILGKNKKINFEKRIMEN